MYEHTNWWRRPLAVHISSDSHKGRRGSLGVQFLRQAGSLGAARIEYRLPSTGHSEKGARGAETHAAMGPKRDVGARGPQLSPGPAGNASVPAASIRLPGRKQRTVPTALAEDSPQGPLEAGDRRQEMAGAAPRARASGRCDSRWEGIIGNGARHVRASQPAGRKGRLNITVSSYASQPCAAGQHCPVHRAAGAALCGWAGGRRFGSGGVFL